MEINKIEGHGRTLLVEFQCQRCKTTCIRKLKDCLPKECDVRGMYDLAPPSEWSDGGFYYPLFCPKCKEEYHKFINGEDLNNA